MTRAHDCKVNLIYLFTGLHCVLCLNDVIYTLPKLRKVAADTGGGSRGLGTKSSFPL